MANTQNLKRGNPDTQFKSGQNAVENGRKGGIASGEAKRRKKTMRELAQALSVAEIKDERARKSLKQLGFEDEELTNNALVVGSVLKAATKGSIAAVDKWEQMIAQDDIEEHWELPASVIGRAYVDINRHIVPNVSYVFEGGRGSIKSTYISEKIIELLKKYPFLHAVVVRKVAGTLKDSVYAQFVWSIDKLGLTEEFELKKSPLEIVYKKTGQTIYFRGVDEPTKLKGIKPRFGYCGILWKEEADQLNGEEEERSINQSVLRGGDIAFDFSSYNPPKSKDAWVHKKKATLQGDPNTVYHKSTYKEVPPEWLGQKFINDAERLKELNPEAYENEYMGEANGSGGNVFDNVEVRTITDEEISRFDTIYQGVDFGWFPDKYVFVRVAYEPAQERIYLLDEHAVNKESNAITGQWILDHGYDDYPITCDSAEPKSINDYKDIGLPAKGAIKGAGSIDYGMKWLQCRTIVIDPERTPYAREEIINYEYERDKDGNVISGYPDANNHSIDALRYSLERFYNKRGTSA